MLPGWISISVMMPDCMVARSYWCAAIVSPHCMAQDKPFIDKQFIVPLKIAERT
jgi:hypothetical protein